MSSIPTKEPTGKVTVLVTDDNRVYRGSICLLLGSDERIKIVGQAANGREAVKQALALKPDVMLMDVAMPVLNGLDAAEQIVAANPAAKVLMLSAYDDDEYVERAIEVGAVGYINKLTAISGLADVICDAAKGKPGFGRSIRKRMAAALEKRRLVVLAASLHPLMTLLRKVPAS